MTTTGWPSSVRSSEGARSRPSAGRTPSVPKHSPVTSCTRAIVPRVALDGSATSIRVAPLTPHTSARPRRLERSWSYNGYDTRGAGWRVASWNSTTWSCPGSTTGSARRTTASMSVKIAVVPPMPRASESAATRAKPGLRARRRSPSRRSVSRSVRKRMLAQDDPSLVPGLARAPGRRTASVFDSAATGAVRPRDRASQGRTARRGRAAAYSQRMA